MSCINKNTQEFKHLLLMSGLDELVLTSKISIYQKLNGLDSYPTLEDLPGLVDASIDNKDFVVSKGFPMQNNNLSKLEDRSKSITIRSRKHEAGVYKFGKYFYKITPVREDLSKASDFGNIEFLKKKFTDEELKLQHIKDFFNDKKPAYVYQILKLDTVLQMKYQEVENEEKIKENLKPIAEDYSKQIHHLKASLRRIEGVIKKQVFGSDSYNKFKEMEASMKDSLIKFEKTKNKQYLLNVAEIELNNIEQLIKAYEVGNRETSDKNIAELLDKLDSLYHIEELAVQVKQLKTRFTAIAAHLMAETVNTISNRKENLSYEELLKEKTDINAFTRWTGALVNSENKIARTIGQLIKNAQIKISGEQGAIYESVKEQTTKLEKWAKANNKSMKETYSMFIQDLNETTVLTRPYSTEFYEKLNTSLKAKDRSYYSFALFNEETKKFEPINKVKYKNDNYNTINKTKELKDFYNFYQKTISDSLEKLPNNKQTEWLKKHPEDFIPNIFTETMADVLKVEGFGNKLKKLGTYISGIKSYEIKDSDLLVNEELERDIIPLKYITKITGEHKSKDLGESLFKFAAMAIEYEQLTEILPKTRLMQRAIGDNSFVNPSKSKTEISGQNSNLYKLVESFIDMQILGNKTTGKDEFKISDLKDEAGNIVGKKVIKMGDIADFGLTWNSLLRIGLNPVSAFTNLVIGEIGNITEAVGGRFFNVAELNKATGIFTAQILENGEITNKKSKVNNLIEKYPMLQELTDYEYSANLSIKQGLTGEKLKNYMYSMQKGGEVFLQTRTMIAMMLHTKPDGKISLWEMLDEKGDLKAEHLKHFGTKEQFNDYMLRNSTKIMGVNEQIHGRYSTRDAAALNQNVLARMAFQFKKWIPAAYETRFQSKYYNDRLMVDVEGRWVTFSKMIYNFKDTAKRYSEGTLTELEVYNFRKTMTEATILLGTILGALALGWDDDEKRKRSAGYKFAMDQLDKVSGDLLFLSNPKNVTALTKTPFAMTKLANGLIDVVTYIPKAAFGDEETQKKFNKKGFKNPIGKVIPGYNQVFQNVPELWNDLKYVDRTN